MVGYTKDEGNMKRNPKAFMSYAHVDNKYGKLTEFRERLSNEVHVQTGEEFPIFQDSDNILLGQNWRDRIEAALEEEVKFLIPIITPSFFNSNTCRQELEMFLQRETALKRNDLVLPIYYVSCKLLEDEELKKKDHIAEAIASRQWADWRGLRFESFDSPEVCKAIERIASQIRLALDRIMPTHRAKASETKPTNVEEIDLFIVYSYKDERLWEQLERHLSLLAREGLITSWHDRRILPGEEWRGEIDSHLERANLILLLISADFLASDYCYDIEIKRALERHNCGDARVIPIILRPTDWGGTPFAKLQALPTDARPITTWANRDKALFNVVQGIRKIIEKYGGKEL